jgi:hypothetical protein
MILALCQAVFTERLVLVLATGGRGMVMITDLLTPLITLAAIVIPFRMELLALLRKKRFFLFFPFLFLAFLLPLLGVAFNNFPARSAYTSWIALIPLCFITFGYFGSKAVEDERACRVIRRYFLFGVYAQVALAALQALGEMSSASGIFGAVRDWDLAFKFKYQPNNLILGRSTGFYLNPNSLGIWALLAVWTSFFLLKGRQRFFGVTAGVATVILCQSRGSLAAMLVSGMIYGVVWTFFHANRNQRLKGTLLAAVCVIPVMVLALPGLADTFLGDLHNLPYVGNALDRYVSGAKVLSQGAGADANFHERTNYWRTAMEYLAQHPFGSLGSPEMVIKRPSDNQFVAVLEQGSFYFVTALIVAFIGGIRLINRPEPEYRLLAVMALSLTINGISAVPFAYSAAFPFWLLVGVYLGGTAGTRTSVPLDEEVP